MDIVYGSRKDPVTIAWVNDAKAFPQKESGAAWQVGRATSYKINTVTRATGGPAPRGGHDLHPDERIVLGGPGRAPDTAIPSTAIRNG